MPHLNAQKELELEKGRHCVRNLECFRNYADLTIEDLD